MDDVEPGGSLAEWQATRRQACAKLHKALEKLRRRAREVDALQAETTGVRWPWWAGECLEILEHVTEAYDLIAGLSDPDEILDEMADL